VSGWLKDEASRKRLILCNGSIAERFEQTGMPGCYAPGRLARHALTSHSFTLERDWPELATWLRSLQPGPAEQAHTSFPVLAAPAPLPSCLAQSQSPGAMAGLECEPYASLAGDARSDIIPGGKWQQITRFAQASQQALADSHPSTGFDYVRWQGSSAGRLTARGRVACR